jgi:Protein of unknown function (DUF4235)
MIKLLYKPAGMLVSVLGGVVAGAIFKRVWKVAAREDDAPKAVIDRGAAAGTRRLTGAWPGDEGEPSGEGT